MNGNKWFELATQITGECWCDAETEGIIMDENLATAFAKRLVLWIETAAQNQNNADYYRGLVIKCGKSIGKEAYIQNDGGISTDVLCAKVPELVEKLARGLSG
jgi:hypothetical protein